jgi:hypothetical protein
MIISETNFENTFEFIEIYTGIELKFKNFSKIKISHLLFQIIFYL